jgi:dihydrofolate synthase/folylpolyglutamate synthase
MTYAETVSYLLTVGQELRGVKFDLANVSRLLEALGHPERCWNSVHIAGTNGKGSVAAMMEAVLRTAGYRTGLYTSPHLVRVNERIRVAGEEISDADFASVCGDVLALVERLLAERALPGHPSFFECLTATAFEHFRRAGCDIAVLETGMGGRLDATNVVRPLVSVITPVDFDHEAYLGYSLGQIAFEKAGIIKEGGVAIAAPQRPEAAAVIEQVARQRGARLVVATEVQGPKSKVQGHQPADLGLWTLDLGPLRVALPGRHQEENARLVVLAAEQLRRLGLRISGQALRQGLAGVRWPGRLEWIQGRPRLLLDGAHNPAGARALRAYLEEVRSAECGVRSDPASNIVLLFGAMRDKAVAEMADLLFPLAAAVVLTRPPQKRAATTQVLAQLTGHLNHRIIECEDPGAALAKARDLAGPDGIVVVTGSLYLVGSVRQLLEVPGSRFQVPS